MRLTQLKCQSAKPKEKTYKLSDGEGLYLEITPKGGKYWRLKYRFANHEKRLAIGVFPEIGLKEARDKTDQAKKMLRDGQDPSFEKQERKRQLLVDASNTFERVAGDWFEHSREKWADNTADTNRRRLERDIFPAIGHLPIKNITTPRLIEMVKEIEKRGAYEIARRAWQTCDQIFTYAMQTGRGLTANPAYGNLRHILKPVKKGHYASIEINELPALISKIRANDLRLFLQTRLAIELMMLTFVRTGELISAKWSEIDLDDRLWTIPAERMKMRESHLVPLSKQSIEILLELKRLNGHREHVFPGQRNPRGPMSNGAILMALDRMGYRGKMTGHGFRSLAMSTIKERLDYRHEVIDRQLAHAHKNQVDAAYDRAKFLEERKKMMQDWADYLDKVSVSNVISFKTQVA
ncbi:MAG: tyrosine-type recombinase/integrase [Micavibrio sp.]